MSSAASATATVIDNGGTQFVLPGGTASGGVVNSGGLEFVLPGGTAYQTDCGMTGPYESVIGVDTGIIIQRFLTGLPVRMEAARKGGELHAVIVDVDEATGKARAIRRHAINGD